jgi:prepilin-type N-terminal cleavage/methylation domain-containing protein
MAFLSRFNPAVGRRIGQMSLKRGFSLIEMVMVVAILLALTYFALPAGEIIQVKAAEKLLRERLFEVRRAIDAYVAARSSDGNSPYPTSLKALTLKMTAPIKPGASVNSGPFLALEALGNPFKGKGDVFFWDIRRDDGTWVLNQTDPEVVTGVFDVRFPIGGVDGWKKAIDETNYSDW